MPYELSSREARIFLQPCRLGRCTGRAVALESSLGIEEALPVDHHREHPSKPEQPDDGFDEGQRDTLRGNEAEPEPRFSRGQEKTGLTPEKLEHEDFARGQDSDVPTPEQEVERRFSEGQEKLPHKKV
jgi:hypothetical protein